MPIEMYGSDEAGHLMLMPDPTPERTPGATAPPAGEPPLPGLPEAPAAAETPAAPPPAPADDLAALRRLIEEREQARTMQEARRDAQLDTMTRVLSGAAPAVPETPPAPTGPTPEPQDHEFASSADYVKALSRWQTQQDITAFKQEQQQAAQQHAQQQALLTRDQVVKQAEEAFVTAHPDYVEVVHRGLVAKTPLAFRQLLMLSDDAPAVAYAIAKDEALLGRLMQMPPQQLFYALGRLSGQNGGSAPPATTDTAPPAGGGLPAGGLPPGGMVPAVPMAPGRPKPPPPRPLSGTGVAPVGGFREDMSQAEYTQWRTTQGAASRA